MPRALPQQRMLFDELEIEPLRWSTELELQLIDLLAALLRHAVKPSSVPGGNNEQDLQ